MVNATSDGGVINLTKDYSYKSGSTDGILINKSITIDGNNHRLDGNAQSRIFTTYDGKITLKNLILVNGFSKNGGAIFANGNITLQNVVFENNRATMMVEQYMLQLVLMQTIVSLRQTLH